MKAPALFSVSEIGDKARPRIPAWEKSNASSLAASGGCIPSNSAKATVACSSDEIGELSLESMFRVDIPIVK
jgi:hypothetical protein